MATLPEQLERLEAAVTRRRRHRALGARRRRGERDRRARSRARISTDEVIKVKSLATDEIGINEALEAEGIHALETDLAELIVQLDAGRQAVAHPRARDPPQPGRDPHAVRAHDRQGPIARQRGARDRRGRPAAPALEVPDGAGRGLGRELRDRRDGHDRRRRVRGQRAHVPHAAEGPRHADGDREGAAGVAGPRGLPAAAPAVLDRRAHEPVHVAVDGRARPATARRSSI